MDQKMSDKQKIFLYALRHENDSEWCSKQCFFYYCGYCSIFNTELEDAILPEPYEWQEEPEKERCLQCKMMD